MIEKKQLRWGNLIALNLVHGTPIAIVDQIKNRGVVWEVDGVNGYAHFKDILPIELSPEWLNKLGFNQTKRDIWELRQLRLWLGNGCFCYLIDEDSRDGHYLPNGTIHSVHQLMNLFYALTGEELTIKP